MVSNVAIGPQVKVVLPGEQAMGSGLGFMWHLCKWHADGQLLPGVSRTGSCATRRTHSLPVVFPSFQLTVEMFDYMDCELKLSESGEQYTEQTLGA
jgi:hypothetical protein